MAILRRNWMPTVTYQQALEIAGQHHRAGRLAEAEEIYRQILAVEPRCADALHLLGVIAGQMNRTEAAVDLIRQAIALTPGVPDFHSNLGEMYRRLGRFDEASAALRQAIVLRPDFPEAHYNLGGVLLGMGQLDEAIAAYRQAIALRPSDPEAHSNRGVALYEKGQLDDAIAAYRRAVALRPDYPEAHANLAHALLRRGDFREGWEEYEWRWKREDAASLRRDFTQPLWDGTPLERRTILIHTEQGFGDALQFIRYAPLVARRGGQVIIECQPELARLFETIAVDLPVVARGRRLPAFDVHCPLLSLPRLFATDLASIPQNVPYLHADPTDTAMWRDRLSSHSSPVKVGLVWAGRPENTNDKNRSLRLASLAPLAGVAGVRFFSMQKGGAASEAKSPPDGMEWIDAAVHLKDFADTAALIANLDLVISPDTAVAHLAGAMGRPVWTLLPFAAHWTWMLERGVSPWYPTMRLFRQPKRGDWESVISEVRAQLELLAKSRG